MDVFISAPQGAGKTRLAEKIIEAHYGYARHAAKNIPVARFETVEQFYGAPRTVARKLHMQKHQVPQDVIVFDGVLTSPEQVIRAVKIVKEYRKNVNVRVLAIYIEQGGALIVTDNDTPPINIKSNFKNPF